MRGIFRWHPFCYGDCELCSFDSLAIEYGFRLSRVRLITKRKRMTNRVRSLWLADEMFDRSFWSFSGSTHFLAKSSIVRVISTPGPLAKAKMAGFSALTVTVVHSVLSSQRMNSDILETSFSSVKNSEASYFFTPNISRAKCCRLKQG